MCYVFGIRMWRGMCYVFGICGGVCAMCLVYVEGYVPCVWDMWSMCYVFGICGICALGRGCTCCLKGGLYIVILVKIHNELVREDLPYCVQIPICTELYVQDIQYICMLHMYMYCIYGPSHLYIHICTQLFM